MESFTDDPKSCRTCPTCDREFKRPRRKIWSWIAAIAVSVAIAIVIYLSGSFRFSIQIQRVTKSLPAVDHDSHLVGDISTPLNHHQTYQLESHPAEYWHNQLYFGEPSYESDYAWNNLTYPRTFRLHRHEAERLNFTDSVLIEPGEDFATILGVIHNLHCLRRFRQMMYPDYYYPDAEPDELDYNRKHALHCLESLRTSLLCYPDLNPHPYYWSGNKYHDITVSGKISRQCVDWEALQERLEPRNFPPSLLMHGTGPPG